MKFPEYSRLKGVIFDFNCAPDDVPKAISSIRQLADVLISEKVSVQFVSGGQPETLLSAAKTINAAPSDCIVIECSPEAIGRAMDERFIVVGAGTADAFLQAPVCFHSLDAITADSLKDIYAAHCPDLWTISQSGICEAGEPSLHTLLTVGNGRIGVRGSIPELPAGNSQGIYLAGFFDRMTRAPVNTSKWGEFYHYIGYEDLAKKERSEIYMVKCPDFLDMKWTIDDERIDFSQGTLLAISRELDLRRGLFSCRAHWRSPIGKEIVLVQKRFADMVQTNRVAAKYELELLNCSGTVTAAAGISTNTKNTGDNYITTIYGKPDQERLYDVLAREQTGDHSAGILIEGKKDKQRAAFATSLLAVSDHQVKYEYCETPSTCAVRITLHAEQNSPVRLNRVACFALSRLEDNPFAAVKQSITAVPEAGFEQISAASSAFWVKYWNDSDIFLEGDAKTQLILRHSLYNLLIAASQNDPGVSIGAKALTGERYQGVVFWDTDIHMLPFYLFTQPQLAKNIVEYRYRLLDGARRKAAGNGLKGAQFPWCSAVSGDEECPRWLKWVTHQLHIVADVAYAAQNYVNCTGDENFYQNIATELLIESARFWVSKAVERGDEVSIPDAGGPDECHVCSIDSAYVNNLACYNLSMAEKAASHLQENNPKAWSALCGRIGLSPDELQKIKTYQTRIRRMQMPDGLFEQAQGFFQLKDGIVVGEEPGKEPHLTQTVKQADVLMMIYLLDDLRTKSVLQANWDYYEPRTIHSSSLSYGVHGILAAELGLVDRAGYYLKQSLGIDLGDTHGNAAGGAHMAAHGMSWSAVINGFAGSRPVQDDFVITPRLPENWQRLRFNLKWRKADFIVDIFQNRVLVKNKAEAGAALPIIVKGRKFLLQPGDTLCE